MSFCANSGLEILAPATVSTYKSAVNSGANAIYFGYGELNARAGADNFSDLEEVVAYCHRYGVKAYLTLNIMLKNSELQKATEIVKHAESAKIDAFIISDLALLPIIRKYSRASVHASTQCGIHNVAGARLFKNLGFNRIILSREVKPSDIKAIKEAVDIELEIFGHGALCIGFSGACLFSSVLTGKSGNRGRCLQLCRRKYDLVCNGESVDNGFMLSAKDIDLSDEIDYIKELGVTSLKLEGRLKNVNYVSGITSVYSEINAGRALDKQDIENFKILFNRGFTKGYWNGKDVVNKNSSNHIGLKCGKIIKILSKNLVLVATDREIKKDDSFRVIRNGEEIGGIVATGELKLFENKALPVCFAPCNARIGDTVYLTKSAFNDKKRKINIDVHIKIIAGTPIEIKAFCRNKEYSYIGEIAEYAKTTPLTKEQIAKQFSKTGDDYAFSLSIETDNSFVPVSRLNELRRSIISHFETEFIENYDERIPIGENIISQSGCEKISGDFAVIDSISCLESVKDFKNIVYSPYDYFSDDCKSFYNTAKNTNNSIFVILPIYISTENETTAREIIRIFDGVIVNNPGIYQMAVEENKKIIAGWNLNIANSENFFYNNSNQSIPSVELNSKEIRMFPDALIYAFGKLPLMYLNFCPKRLINKNCADCTRIKTVALRDEKGEYEITTKKMNNYCLHEMKNSQVTNLGKLCENHPRYFDFCGFTDMEIKNILDTYYSDNPVETTNFNHLHMKRGVI